VSAAERHQITGARVMRSPNLPGELLGPRGENRKKREVANDNQNPEEAPRRDLLASAIRSAHRILTNGDESSFIRDGKADMPEYAEAADFEPKAPIRKARWAQRAAHDEQNGAKYINEFKEDIKDMFMKALTTRIRRCSHSKWWKPCKLNTPVTTRYQAKTRCACTFRKLSRDRRILRRVFLVEVKQESEGGGVQRPISTEISSRSSQRTIPRDQLRRIHTGNSERRPKFAKRSNE